jgi:cyclic-di-GMP phosphodiesterase TipF (flagellum assembly factor)
MFRTSTIFVAICIVLVAASLGLILYEVAGVSGTQSAIAALTALTSLTLCNVVSTRLRDRSDVGSQIADLSRGMADLARQMAEFGCRPDAMEGRAVSTNSTTAQRIQSVVAEINELSSLVKQLAAKVSAHGDLPAAVATSPTPAPIKESAAPDKSPPVLAMLKSTIEENRIDIFLQPIVTLPQRKVRFYEAVPRLRDERDQILSADVFIGAAESSSLIGRIDHIVMLRCVQVLRRLKVRNKDISVFCNIAASTLANEARFSQCLDFLEANRALASSLVLEFKQATFRYLGPT